MSNERFKLTDLPSFDEDTSQKDDSGLVKDSCYAEISPGRYVRGSRLIAEIGTRIVEQDLQGKMYVHKKDPSE